MARLARHNELPVEKTEHGPGKTPLYYNNVGLFSDPFLEDRLPNLEKYYNNPSTKFLNDYWNIDEFDAVKFNKAYQDIMDLWVKLGKDVSKFCANERQLQNRWIDKVFEYLGWTIELEETVSRHGTTNFPDYGLYKDFDDLSKSKDLKNKFKKALAVADAKAWGINLDGKGFSNKNPSYQIVNYLKQTDKTWGILTDGRYWRIYSVRSESKHTTFYEIDLIKILRAGDYERFKYFYNFFRMDAFEPQARLSDRCFLDFVFEDGQFYSQRVESNLQERVYKVVDTICKGFLESHENPSDEELKDVYEYSMYYLFKLMFVLNCESKGLLEVNKQDDYYEFSLRKKCMDIKDQYEEGKNWSGQPRTYNYVNDLFELLKHGDGKIGVHGFGDELFEIGSDEFYIGHKISDENLNHALLELACDYDEDDSLQFIDYKILSPDHIGSLFEGLLEFSLVKKGKNIELLNTKGERKSTGSYYTPEYLVDYIVEETITPLVDDKNPSEILNLNIVDPSMGSGHFLLGVVKFLERKIVELQDSDKKVKGAIDFDKIRKEVLKKCVYGVDINSLATQLAKFSLWIYTSQKGDKLELLADQLYCGDSLVDSDHEYDKNLDWKETFPEVFNIGGFDAVVGNPPYLGEKGNKDLFQFLRSQPNLSSLYQRRMDLFYFFFHKSIEILKKDGLAALVSTNYYVTASEAANLRTALRDDVSLSKVTNFNDFKIFKSAQGQHNMVTFFKKSQGKKKVAVFDVKGKGKLTKEKFDEFLENQSKHTFSLAHNKFFDGEDAMMRMSKSVKANSSASGIFEKMEATGLNLKSFCSMTTGIQTGADKISPKHIKRYENNSYDKGDGIFVLSKEEIVAKGLQGDKNIKPWFKNSDVERYYVNEKNKSFVTYLADQGEKISISKGLKKHFEKYKQLLIDRLSVCKSNKFQWNIVSKWIDRGEYYLLFYPRKEHFFKGPKIVVPQRSPINTFGYTEKDWYASVDVYFIKPNSDDVNLKLMLGILNSRLYYYYLYHKGKRKGENLELYLKPMAALPMPNISFLNSKKIISEVDKLIKSKGSNGDQSLIDEELYRVFNLTEKEVEQVENLASNSKYGDVA